MNTEIENKLINLVSGNIEDKEKDELLEKIYSDPDLLKQFQSIKNAWALSTYNKKVDQHQIDMSFNDFVKKIKTGKKILFLRYLKYAAIAILFLSLGVLSNEFIFNESSLLKNKDIAMNDIVVPNGDKAQITLADGTKVWLNSGTKFHFPAEFKGKSRNVNIEGEAYFEVTKSKQAFIVNTSYGDIKVLGTSFNVRAYKNMNFQANLIEGSIQFSKDSVGKLLKPGEQLVINDKQEIVISKFDNPSSYTWKDGIITFQNESLKDVVKKLEFHYDISISLDAELSDLRFTGKIYNESIEEVMTLINKIEPINYTYNKDSNLLYISSKTN